jgi:uncharacterized protein YbaP (TraB family)
MRLLFLIIYFIVGTSISFGQSTEQSLFWEISGNGLSKKSYLYGTMHVQDSRVFQFKDDVLNALDNADFCLFELNLDSVNSLEVITSLIMNNETTLESLVKKKEFALIKKYFTDSLQLDISLFNRIQPFYTASMIGSKEFKQEETMALDAYFFDRAKSKSISCLGLEKLSEQIATFSSIPYTFQITYLMDIINSKYNGKPIENELDKMLDLYVKGNIEGLLAFTLSNFTDEEFKNLFEREFIKNRNETMTKRLVPYIQLGSSFIAVGAAHLGGSYGIIQLLKDKGYTVKAM